MMRDDQRKSLISWLAREMQLPLRNLKNIIGLLEQGSTIAFIARYRKEATGSLNEVRLSEIAKRWQQLQELEKRRAFILSSIEEQGKLNSELQKKIAETYDAIRLEDLYLPYKKKRKTRATVAKEKGLEPLANWLFEQSTGNVHQKAKACINQDVPDTEHALQGARDIIAEWFSEGARTRQVIRRHFRKFAIIHAHCPKRKRADGVNYRDYFDYEEKLSTCPSHRLLALLRGAAEGVLRVHISPPTEAVLAELERTFIKNNTEAARQVSQALQDAYKRLLQPSIETAFRNDAKDKADKDAIAVFSSNLRQLLLQAPLGNQAVLAIDPGFRSGCKLVCLDEAGKLLEFATIYPNAPINETARSQHSIHELIKKHHIKAIAVGNGTAGQETSSFLRQMQTGLPLFVVNENGASIYSASAVAREEFPDLDLTIRGAISIGRRLMDPLAELVKIDPKSIGVGQYQHDVNQTLLRDALNEVVASCVNSVGVNVNTASKHILLHISGLGPTLAKNIVTYREENGLYKSKAALKKVPRLGSKAFEQCAGFLRIREGKQPLDNTGVHPERYALVKKMAADQYCTIKDLLIDDSIRKKISLQRYVDDTVGIPTLEDILRELGAPGLDPRGHAEPFAFAEGIHQIEDLKAGMVLPGIVNNITRFGAFIDIGVHQDGLVHVSELAIRFIKDPAEVVKLHQHVRVKILQVDLTRQRIHLSMKAVEIGS